jgi:hypothetical protein
MTSSAGTRLRILLSGMVAGDPHQGGATWAVMQYLLGLRKLGHEVVLVEPVAPDLPAEEPLARSASAAYLREVPREVTASYALLREGTRETVGLAYEGVERFAREADLLLNISGMLRDQTLISDIPVRAYLDLDPGFNQVWSATGEDAGLEGHTHFVTVGQAIGSPECPVPTCGRSWIGMLPPVLLREWPAVARPPARDAFTTVGHWRSYGSVEYEGIRYGQRVHSFRELMELPRRASARFEVALGIHPDERRDIESLGAHGWNLIDPMTVAPTPDRYREFVQGSKAEIGIAKGGYVACRCGWFSDRSAAYLASGRPVVAQDTGFPRFLPTGDGLLAFATLQEAAERVEEVERGPARHSAAAREIAVEHLDSDRVLGSLLERLGAST